MLKAGTLAVAGNLGKYARSAAIGLVALACGAAAAAAHTLSPADLSIYRSAFEAAQAGRWNEARALASRAGEKLPAKVVHWMDLARPNTAAGFDEIAGFIRANPDWPNLSALRRNAEAAMPLGLEPARIRAWFAEHPPLTGAGVIRYASALLAGGETEAATEFLRKRWVSGGFGTQEEQEILSRFGRLLRPADHIARLDRLVWDGEEAAAERMYRQVGPGWRALATARLLLASLKPGVDTAIQRVPAELRDDPGLVYERARWRRRKGIDDGAVQLLLDERPKTLGRPDAWWQEMHIMARRAIEKGDFRLAYRLARNHGQSDGLSFAQAEFLAGWLALRFLNEPQAALKHFTALYEGVGAPISLARGAYWAGRAAEALNRGGDAREWYERAARHSTTYYGQLALDRLHGSAPIPLPSEPAVPASVASDFEQGEMVRIVRLLNQIDPDLDAIRLFVMRLSGKAKNAADYALVTALAHGIDRPDLAVHVAKQAVQDDVVLIEGGYPLLPDIRTTHPEPALVHALIRQESTFNQHAISPVGARGLMQLMPATARQIAGQLGLQHSDGKLTADPAYNIRLGTTFIRDLLDRFNGSYVLAIAAYNAGPSRVQGWLKQFGDPRASGIDVVDWIELMPIYETRNYVQRIMEGLAVYRARADGGRQGVSITDDLNR